MMHPMRFSRALAWAGGVLLPVVETIRRWHQLGDPRMLPFWLDDWIIGLFLLYGAWVTREDRESGRPTLAAAWGFACGMGYLSFFSDVMSGNSTDPSGLSSFAVAMIKGLMFGLAISALNATLRAKPRV